MDLEVSLAVKMNFTIRPATKADSNDMWRMIKELAIHEKKLEEVTLSYEEFEMDGFGQKPSFESFVAKVPEENKSKEGFTTVGVALYFYTYNSWKGRALYLDVLYVMTEFRGFGIGKGLLSRVAKVAREKSCQIMELNVLGHNSQSRGFYAAHGAQDITIREGWHTQRFEEESLNKLAHNAP